MVPAVASPPTEPLPEMLEVDEIALPVTLAGLFFLSGGVAPAEVRKRFRIALAVEVVAVVAAASVTITRSPWVPFGVLAPMFGLGLMSVWGGRFGVYPAKEGT